MLNPAARLQGGAGANSTQAFPKIQIKPEKEKLSASNKRTWEQSSSREEVVEFEGWDPGEGICGTAGYICEERRGEERRGEERRGEERRGEERRGEERRGEERRGEERRGEERRGEERRGEERRGEERRGEERRGEEIFSFTP
ncbi:hypothetical protein HGM15179_007855 [Zosterops borbonicus]|uniref:Uncharacterized protein n=1 Tax=Zosterops borbonicus TaxID=364589 RepID=A0A8K1GKA5_9PASS|nr:hypothetical protein HGM15179_007855 [Zosterops borbonicus]